MRLEEQQPTDVDQRDNAADRAGAVRTDLKELAALSPAECDRVYRVIFAGDVDPRHPARWNPILP